MMKELILATGNRHKVAEIREILRGLPVRIVALDELRGVPEIVEDGTTLEENAAKKARVVARRFKQWALADDSGLEVDYLKGEPGVYSARWAGPGCTYADNNAKLLSCMTGVPKSRRNARFRCVIALSDARGRVWSAEGRIAGRIAERPRGKRGFGYDPVFFIPSCGKTFAELGTRMKNSISHRSRALRKAQKLVVQQMLNDA
jgi:XTP/dITP diphosphohydrolase